MMHWMMTDWWISWLPLCLFVHTPFVECEWSCMFTYLCGYLWHLTDWLSEGCPEWWLTDGSVDYVFVYLCIIYLQNVIGVVCLLIYVDVYDMFVTAPGHGRSLASWTQFTCCSGSSRSMTQSPRSRLTALSFFCSSVTHYSCLLAFRSMGSLE